MSAIENDPLFSSLLDHVKAVQLCLSNHLQIPALALIYCGIDFMGNISRPEQQAEQTRGDFIRWAEKHMSCVQRFGVSGLDLYAARCGVLHTYTMDSRLSTEGKAKRILYAWGNKSPEEANKLLRSLGFQEVVIKLEDLGTSFVDGIESFTAMLKEGTPFAAVVKQRSRKFFKDQSSFPGVDD